METNNSSFNNPRSVSEMPAYLPVRPTRLRMQRLVFALSLIIPAIGFIAAPIVSWRVGFSWVEPVTFLVMLTITGLGIEAGYHRLFSHRSYKTTQWMRILLAIAGNMAVQGPVIYWVAYHRIHHPFADKPDDPHSPIDHPKGDFAGFLHAHFLWFFGDTRASSGRWARDLMEDRSILMVNQLNALWMLLSVAIPAAIGGLGTWSMEGALVGALWGGLARICFGQQFTYFINSVCHIWGTQPYRSNDNARNVWWLVLPTYGAGLHNNHHCFPRSATYDFKWWHLDPSAWFIRTLKFFGLAWDLRRPSDQDLSRRIKKVNAIK